MSDYADEVNGTAVTEGCMTVLPTACLFLRMPFADLGQVLLSFRDSIWLRGFVDEPPRRMWIGLF